MSWRRSPETLLGVHLRRTCDVARMCRETSLRRLFTEWAVLEKEVYPNCKKIMRKSNQVYYEKYFEANWNNIKNTLKGIRSIIFLKTIASCVQAVLSLDNGDTITNLYDTGGLFNIYFASISETT